MTKKYIEPIHVFHYPTITQVDSGKINNHPDSIVIIRYNEQNKTEQIRVMPFNYENENKKLLDFKEKLKYFKKIVTGSNQTVIIPGNPSVLATDFTSTINEDDGFLSEYNAFIQGFENPQIDQKEDDLIRFFVDNFIDISELAFLEFSQGILENQTPITQ